jgi:hypothetical protein
MDITVPITPEKPPKIRYNVPISLWLVENNHLEDQLYNAVGILLSILFDIFVPIEVLSIFLQCVAMPVLVLLT